MSNRNFPSGLTAVKNGAGGVLRPNTLSDYAIASAYGTSIFRGDPVAPTTTGNPNGPGVEIALVAAGANSLMGAFGGCNYVASNGDTQFRPYWAASTTLQTGTVAEATVFDDPDTLFDIQVSGAAGLANTNIGNTANWLAGTGNPATGQSAGQLDQSTLSGASTTQQLQVASLKADIGNAYGQYARALVSIFLHYRNAATKVVY